MNRTIKIFLTVILVGLSVRAVADLPSWGMTENQYKLPNFETKMGDIGVQAFEKNWALKITAPKDWHGKIRTALTDTGARDVQVTFKDSLYQSIAISAVKGAKIAHITSSASNATVQKQVVIEKPEIDTEIEAPDFGDTSFKNNSNELLENITGMEINIPHVTLAETEDLTTEKSAPKAVEKVPAVKTDLEPTKPVVEAVPEVLSEAALTTEVAVEDIEANKELLRKQHARTKRVNKELSYTQIQPKDDLFIKDSVVLVKRFVNQGVVLYFWMKEAYNPEIHMLVSKGSGKYQKDLDATSGETSASEPVAEVVVQETKLDFVAVDDMVEDQDDLRRDFGNNKRVDNSIGVTQLKEDDVLYVQNQTVLVVRPITKSQNIYLWLVGDTTINREVEKKDDNIFIIK